MDLNILANFGMLSLVVGTLPLMYTVIKNRKTLKDYNIIGALGITIGQLAYLVYFYLLNDYITALLSIPLIVFWIFVSIFRINVWRKKNEV